MHECSYRTSIFFKQLKTGFLLRNIAGMTYREFCNYLLTSCLILLKNIPQYAEVPPNIEVRERISCFSAAVSQSTNTLLLSSIYNRDFFLPVGKQFAIMIFIILVILRMTFLSGKHMDLSEADCFTVRFYTKENERINGF